MEKKFKKGDRVRFIGNEGPWVEYQVTDGDEGIVEDNGYYDDEISVNFGGHADVPADDLELVETYDARKAFLSELKELLEKYDANIEAYQSDFESVSMDINIGDKYTITRGGYENIVGIDAENIMDYEKE